MPTNKELKLKYLLELQKVRLIVNSFDLAGLIVAGCPDDEYDSLNLQILSLLYSNRLRIEIRNLILKEVLDFYGVDFNDLSETNKIQFYSELEKLLDKLETEIEIN